METATLNGARTSFRIFDPDSPPMTADETLQIRTSGHYRQMMESLNGPPNTQSGEPRAQNATTQRDQPNCLQLDSRRLSSRIEALLDLHQQQLEAIQQATQLIANSLENAPDDHT